MNCSATRGDKERAPWSGETYKFYGQKMKLKRAKLEQNEPALVMIRLGNLAEHLGFFLTRSKILENFRASQRKYIRRYK